LQGFFRGGDVDAIRLIRIRARYPRPAQIVTAAHPAEVTAPRDARTAPVFALSGVQPLSGLGGGAITIRKRPELIMGDIVANGDADGAQAQPEPKRRDPKICGGGFNVDLR
jgi:hypothetical protein